MQHATVSFSNGDSEPLIPGIMEEKEPAVQYTVEPVVNWMWVREMPHI